MRISTVAAILLCCSAFWTTAQAQVQPFDDAQRDPPPNYPGPTFKLSHAYPASAAVPAMPWRAAIDNQPISPANAQAYAEALKAAIGKDMRVLLQDYGKWDAGQRGWYNEPWLGKTSTATSAWKFREPLRGMYVGSQDMGRSLFKQSGLKNDFSTYVLVYYDKTAAVTLNNIWGASAMTPSVTPQTTQFAEGSIIVKAAFITADPATWPVMKGTVAWPAYITFNAGIDPNNPLPNAALTQTYLMQFDIIVKDSVSAPKTGWVFTTLVYDTRVPAPDGDIWKKMVVLGAQWGNDPQANNGNVLKPKLVDNYINPKSPAYGRATLGWGERLSGPNDGAMNNIAFDRPGSLQPTRIVNAKDSSCMSCHSSAQWDNRDQKLGMKSFLLPALTPTFKPLPSCKDRSCAGFLGSPPPSSEAWMKWFQNRLGDQAMDPSEGNVAGDFDMVLTFKTLPAWFSATQNQGQHQLLKFDRRGHSAEAAPK